MATMRAIHHRFCDRFVSPVSVVMQKAIRCGMAQIMRQPPSPHTNKQNENKKKMAKAKTKKRFALYSKDGKWR